MKYSFQSISIAFWCCLVLFACNTNELLPESSFTKIDPDDFLPISDVEISSAFSPNSQQTIQFTTVGQSDNIAKLNFYASHDLNASNQEITNVVIVIHGLSASDANVRAEYNSMMNGIKNAALASKTLVVAPHFFHEGSGQVLDWENAIWRVGGKSSSPKGASLSSVQIVDFLLTNYLLDNDNFSNLSTVVISGHSAGGQLAQRYAAISRVEENYPSYDFNYIVANASHYLYLNPLRWNGSTTYTPGDCAGYNNYPYGLDSLTSDDRFAFVSKIGIETIRGNYIARKVFYVLGDQDVSGATTDCASSSQQGGAGDSRLARGKYMYAFLQDQYPTSNHEYREVPGVGHSSNALYTSADFSKMLTDILK